MDWAWDAPAEMPSGVLFVLVVLGDHGNDHSGEDWSCYPSVERIMARTHLSRATVERHLSWLFAEGWISRKRKVRKDGRLGIYEYVLHRDEGARADLKAERARTDDVAETDPEGGEPCSNLQHGPCVSVQHGPCVSVQHGPCVSVQHGPCVNLDETMPQNEGKPCRKLQHEEPLGEPKTGGREPGDEGFEEAWAAFPEFLQARSSPPAARAAFAKACQEVEADRLVAAIRRFTAEDRDVKRLVGPALQRWLADERWRYWLGEGSPVAMSAPEPRTGFAGPAELRAKIVRGVSNGEAFARSYFDHAAWDAETCVLTPATSMAAQRLGEVRHIIRESGASIGAPVTAGQVAGGKA